MEESGKDTQMVSIKKVEITFHLLPEVPNKGTLCICVQSYLEIKKRGNASVAKLIPDRLTAFFGVSILQQRTLRPTAIHLPGSWFMCPHRYSPKYSTSEQFPIRLFSASEIFSVYILFLSFKILADISTMKYVMCILVQAPITF